MNTSYSDRANGYLETIQKGLRGLSAFSAFTAGTGTRSENLEKLGNELRQADAVVIGAGAGLSTAAGFVYSGERFEKWFFDFGKTYGFHDMYSGGFYPYPKKEAFWAFWARNIYVNRYLDPPKPVYRELAELVSGKDYFVITTNVDHCFQKAGFDRKRLFYTQGDYGLFQSTDPRNRKTYDNREWVMKAMEAQGFIRSSEGSFDIPADGRLLTEIPAALIPKAPDDGSDLIMNLRSDDSFVEDDGWHRASAAYADFLRRHEGLHVLFLEIGVGGNTPVIIKYPFWYMTEQNPAAVYACLNYDDAYCPLQIESRSICIDGDSGAVISSLLRSQETV